nr:reverse transcriptase domain-containing protein [Tanacetum cinerariifolium]
PQGIFDKHYNQLLPILAEKMHQEKLQQEKLKAVKARLNFKEVSQHPESGTPSRRRDLKKGSDLNVSVACLEALNRGAIDPNHQGREKVKTVHEDTGSQGRESKDQALRMMICLSHGHARKQTPSLLEYATLNYQKSLGCQSRMPSNVKTYDGSRDPEDHLKIFHATGKVEKRAMPTWCHMFNSILTESARVCFDDLPLESVDSYDDLKKEFLANYLQQKKCIKDPVEIHHIKQREGGSTEDFMQRFKVESRHVKGAPECMRIFGFMHGITNLKLIKRLHDNIPRSVDKMMRATTTFLRGEVAASNQAQKKMLPAWKQHEVGRKQNFDRRGDFQNLKRLHSQMSRRGFSGHSHGVEEELSEPWILFTDGSSCANGSGARPILTNPEGAEFTYALRFRFEATNSEAKYEGLIAGLRIAKEMGVKSL